MQITLLEVRNFRALEHANVRPGDRNLLIIGGKNRAGKTSLLSALETAFGGAREQPPEPVRHGSRRATIHVELDDGGLVIDRIIDREGRHKLEVHTKEGGKQKAPQKMLDELVGARFLDPLRLLQLKTKPLHDLLVQVSEIDIDLEELAKDRARSFDERRNVNRDLKRAQGTAEQLGPREDPIEVTPAAELLADIAAKRSELADRERATERLSRMDHDLAETVEGIAALDEDRAAAIRAFDEDRASLVSQGEQIKANATTQREALEASPAAEQISKELAELTEQGSKLAEDAGTAAAIDERNTRREAMRVECEELTGRSEILTEQIDECDQKKAEGLAKAKMPIAGLGIDEERVIYNGAPFEQAADSERLHAALAIAAAMSKDIRDVWMRDASLLDKDSLAAVERFADESGCRVWLERVGDDDSQALIIQEGELREESEAAPEPEQ